METFPRYWPFFRGIHRWPVDSPHGALMFSLICTTTNGWIISRDAGVLRRHCTHYDVTVMCFVVIPFLAMISLPSFAHAKKAQLSHQVQTFVAIDALEFGQEQILILNCMNLNFEFWNVMEKLVGLSTSIVPYTNGRHLADEIIKHISFNESISILIQMSRKFVPKGPIDNKLALFRQWLRTKQAPGGRLNKKDGLTRYGDSHVKDKTS